MRSTEQNNMTTGILASGQLGLTVIKHSARILKPIFIATDSHSDGIIKYALENKIPLFKGNPRNKKLISFLIEHEIKCNLLYSINYLFLIEKDVLDSVQYAINFHGSLLPKYRGRTPHVWSIINNEKTTGVTCHLIDEGCDTGDIILQKVIQIDKEVTGAEVLNKFQVLYPKLLLEVHELFLCKKVKLKKQDHSKATFFGKRTPADGEIKWNWQKSRIKNWVRAQSKPYPGAFSFAGKEKVIIDKVIYSDHDFEDSTPNGTIIQIDPKILVKTSNGILELVQVRTNQEKLKVNTKFSFNEKN